MRCAVRRRPQRAGTAVEWARRLDKPNPTAGAMACLYMVKKHKAENIAETISGIRANSTTRDASRQRHRRQPGRFVRPATGPRRPRRCGWSECNGEVGNAGDLSNGKLVAG